MRLTSLVLLLSGCFVSKTELDGRIDADGDGFIGRSSGGDDCDDTDPEVNPEAVEIFYDGVDNDCDPSTVDDDQDGDGAPSNIDCDDEDPAFHPGAEDIPYDGLDHDCAGDDDFDIDGDGAYPAEFASVEDEIDCDDEDPQVHGPEIRCDDIDNDCNPDTVDGTIIDGALGDLDGDGYFICDDDCIDNDPRIFPGAEEVCNGIDDDCDGLLDDGLEFIVYHPDGDSDGFGDPTGAEVSACAAPLNFVPNDGDCDDDNRSIHPDQPEDCNGIDDNCDGIADEGLVAQSFFGDADGDGFGDPDAPLTACALPANASTVSGDCDDTDAEVSPLGVERCDDLDNDCNGAVDDGLFIDADTDGYGADVVVTCDPDAVYVSRGGDCDDESDAIRPDVPDVCDGLDNDCDGITDNDHELTWFYPDADGDGVGVSEGAEMLCAPRPGMAFDDGDCDDDNIQIRPGITEICDGIDNDCSGEADDGLPHPAYFPDSDGDGHGDATHPGTLSCIPLVGHVLEAAADDCDDNRSDVFAGAPEYCGDALDSDCDGQTDDDDAVDLRRFWPDSDDDGHGDPLPEDAFTLFCEQPPGFAPDNDDCAPDQTAVWRGPTVAGRDFHDLGDAPSATVLQLAANESCPDVVLEFGGTAVVENVGGGGGLAFIGPQGMTLRGRDGAEIDMTGTNGVMLQVFGDCRDCTFENFDMIGGGPGTSGSAMNIHAITDGAGQIGTTVTLRDMTIRGFQHKNVPGILTNNHKLTLNLERIIGTEMVLLAGPSDVTDNEFDTSTRAAFLTARGTNADPSHFNTINIRDSVFFGNRSERAGDTDVAVIANRSGVVRTVSSTDAFGRGYPGDVFVVDSLFFDNGNLTAVESADSTNYGSGDSITAVYNSLFVTDGGWAVEDSVPNATDDHVHVFNSTIIGNLGVNGDSLTELADTALYALNPGNFVGTNCVAPVATTHCTQGPDGNVFFVDPTLDASGLVNDEQVVTSAVPPGIDTFGSPVAGFGYEDRGLSALRNLALNGVARQSSTFPGGDAANANDGRLHGRFSSGIVHTQEDTGAWWEVDLGASYAIDTVHLYNRTDGSEQRLTNVHVHVSDVPFTGSSILDAQTVANASLFQGPPSLGRMSFEVGTTGRYVRVQLDGTDYLQLAEVEVFGE